MFAVLRDVITEDKRRLSFAMFRSYQASKRKRRTGYFIIGGLVNYFRFNGPLRQYFSLCRAVSQRERERERERKRNDRREKTCLNNPHRTYCKYSRPLSYNYLNQQDASHWKLTQHHRTTHYNQRESLAVL